MEQKNKPTSRFRRDQEVLSRIPPQAKEMEDAVIGGLLLEPQYIPEVITFLKPEVFYNPINVEIYNAIELLFKDSKPVDILTVVQELKKLGKLDFIGGPYHLTTLTNRIGSALHVVYHARILFQKYISRKIIEISNQFSSSAYDEDTDPLDLLYKIQEEYRNLENGIVQDEITAIDDIISETFEQIKRAKSSAGVLGLQSHLKALNQTISGFQKGFVHIVAGRPGMGKSALAKSIVLSLVQNKKKCRFFSLEMTAAQLTIGFLSEAAEINNQKVAKGDLSQQEWLKLERLRLDFKDYLQIDDTPAINIAYFESQVRKAIKTGVELIVIDYLQLMTLTKTESKNKIREQEISYLSGNIKRIAKQYQIPIILLSQLSRAVEERADKIPQLSDLRESGSIEQDAEVVILCFRPEYYKLFEDKQGNSMRGLAKLIVAKNRFGPIEDIVTKFYPTLTKFDNFESSVSMEDEKQNELFELDLNEPNPLD